MYVNLITSAVSGKENLVAKVQGGMDTFIPKEFTDVSISGDHLVINISSLHKQNSFECLSYGS